LSDR